jgi:hypothetical protein
MATTMNTAVVGQFVFNKATGTPASAPAASPTTSLATGTPQAQPVSVAAS